MAHCPSCHNESVDDFGLVTCQSCGQVYVVNLDGSVQIEGEESSPLQEENIINDEIMVENEIQDMNYTPEENIILEDISTNDDMVLSDESEPQEMPAEAQDFAFNNDVETEETDLPKAPKQINPEDPLEVTAFSNSELSSSESGLIIYDLKIQNIDNAEMREVLSFNLEDERFQWDHKVIMKKIKKGTLLIENLNPVKLQVLVSRLRFEDFKLSWTQKIITNTELEKNNEEAAQDVE